MGIIGDKVFNKEIQVKMLPHVIVFKVCRDYYCLFVYRDTHRNRSFSCNIFAISFSISMHRVVTITDLNAYRQLLSSIYQNINRFSTISSRCIGNKIDRYILLRARFLDNEC